ncbi:MAG: MlaE family lipid ABC transporter permease subunit [Xanthomonadales bacterium]|nr:MlaE family lipid ABC transporter permease subunit [Xanthomonadales bacterium]
MTTNAYLSTEDQPGRLVVNVRGQWVFDEVLALEEATATIVPVAGQSVTFQCAGLEEIDIAGAWVLYDRSEQLAELGIKSEMTGFKAAHFKFLQNIIDTAAIRDYEEPPAKPGRSKVLRAAVERVGQETATHFEDMGAIARSILDGVRKPSLIIVGETIKQIYSTGVQAIPVVVVITFLIGIVTAHQAAGQLEKFGAMVLVVDLVSISITREMGVLLAAIMVAGRSGSAFAASLGVMKLNEEVDAMRVLGLNPNQMLVIPRILGLVIALPILVIFADIAGLAGGALIAVGSLGISSLQFVERVAYSTDLTDFYVGLSKAPVFALLIAMVGTLRGMQVKSSAEELGLKTTTAVVQSIFLIIVADAFFAVLFTRLGI